MGTIHSKFTDDENHALTAASYANIAARDADTDFHVSENINKLVRVDTPLAYFVLVDTAPTWESIGGTVAGAIAFTIHLDANNALYPSNNPAAALSRNGHPVIAFDDMTAENVVFNNTMPNNYSGEDINIDIDWVAETATTGAVTWGVEVEANAPGGNDIDSDSFAAQQTGTSTTNGTSGVITRTTITLTQAEADAIAASNSFRLRVQRVDDAGDTMADDAEVVKISMSV